VDGVGGQSEKIPLNLQIHVGKRGISKCAVRQIQRKLMICVTDFPDPVDCFSAKRNLVIFINCRARYWNKMSNWYRLITVFYRSDYD
jgi:hypothetical protein